MSGLIDVLSSISLFGLSWYELMSIYTLPGLSYAAFHLIKEYRNRPSQFARDLLSAIGRKKSVIDRLLNIVVYAIAVICIGFGWLCSMKESMRKSTLMV